MIRSRNAGVFWAVLFLIGTLRNSALLGQISEDTHITAALQDISFVQDAYHTKVSIEADRAFDYTSYYPNPRLFIVDIPAARTQLEKNFIDFKTGLVDFASIAQIGEGPRPMIRIEFNLARAIQYSLKPSGKKLVLVFRSMNPEFPDRSSESEAKSTVEVNKQISQKSAPSAPREVLLNENDQQLELVLPTSSKPSFKHFELSSPNRLVIDVNDSTFSISKQAVRIGSDLIRRIRFGYGDSQNGRLVRCVFDLSRSAPYSVEAAESAIVIRFQKPAAPAIQAEQVVTQQVVKPSVAQPEEPRVEIPSTISLPQEIASPDLPRNRDGFESLNSIFAPRGESFVLPVPQAALRNVSLIEAPVIPVDIQPKDKRADTSIFEETSPLQNLAIPSEPMPSMRNLVAPDPPEILLPSQSPDPSAASKEDVADEAQVQANVGESSDVNEESPSVSIAKATEPALSPQVTASQTPVPTIAPEPATVTQVAHLAATPSLEVLQDSGLHATSTTTAAPAQIVKTNTPTAAMQVAALQTAAPAAVPEPPSVNSTPQPVALTTKPAPAQDGASHVISAATIVQAPKYNGEPISLELKDADIKDFFRLIGEISGLNIVLDPDVKGSLTIFLNDVPWDQALDVVLKNNSLGKQLDGNVLRIASNATLETEEGQRKRLSDARVLAAELQTETRILSYAKAAELSTVLKKVLSARGDIIVDTRTNAMIISDIPGKFPAIDALIKQLDKKIKQVEIEARVIAATRDFLRDVGVQIGAIYGNYDKNTVAGAIPGNPFTRTPKPSVTIQPGTSGGAQNALPLITNLAANAATSGLSFFAGITDRFLLDTIITAAERHGSAKLLSKPKIITQDNIEGFVQQGVKIPVQTTVNNTVSVQFFDFSLKLTVTPQITDEGTIILQVDVENSTPDFSRQVQGVPTVNTQQTKTTVLALNGGTVVIGGVMVDSEQVNIRQVPGFGSLPVIGNLFKNRSVTKQTQELIFFLSPKIL